MTDVDKVQKQTIWHQPYYSGVFISQDFSKTCCLDNPQSAIYSNQTIQNKAILKKKNNSFANEYYKEKDIKEQVRYIAKGILLYLEKETWISYSSS